MSYATIAELRAYLPQVAVTAANDALLQDVLARANAIVNDALGFEFGAYGAAATLRDVLKSHTGYWFELPAHKAGTVTAVSLVSGRGTTSESTEVVTDWLEESDGRVYADGQWAGGNWYRVTAFWGYGPAPTTIVEVELEIAVIIWRGRDASSWQSDTGADGQGAVSFNRALTWAQRSIIDGVRMRVLGMVHA
jgi:hypothetical protein